MGEIAEAMLDGTLCAGCGVALIDGPDDEPQGFPGYCSRQCAKGHGADWACDEPPARSPGQRRAARQNRERQDAAGKRFPCPDCGKRFRSTVAAGQHHRDVHEPKGARA